MQKIFLTFEFFSTVVGLKLGEERRKDILRPTHNPHLSMATIPNRAACYFCLKEELDNEGMLLL
jgi:hypothetical protein